MRVTVTLVTPQRETDLVLDCDDETPAPALREALAEAAGSPGATVTVAGAPAGTDDPAAAGLGLLDGARVGVGPVEVGPPAPTSTGLQLHVVSGPDCGRVFALPQGVHDLGRTGPLSWNDHSLSRRHFRVIVSPVSVTVTDLGSSNGTFLDGERVGVTPVSWARGALLEVGDSAVELRDARPADAVVEPAEPGWLTFRRPPRIEPFELPAVVELPVPPDPAGGLRPRREEWRRQVESYERALAEARGRLAREAVAEQGRRRAALPDAAETFLTCVLPGRRLWERRRQDHDALRLRVGTADLPSTVVTTGGFGGPGGTGGTGGFGPTELTLRAVPVDVDLAAAGVVGLAGDDQAVDGLLRWIVVQLAAAHAPRDLGMTFLSSRADRGWRWLRWLPHLRPADPDGPAAAIGNDPDTAAAQVATLAAMVRARHRAAATDPARGAAAFRAHVVVVQGHHALRMVPGVAPGLTTVLEEGPAVGVHVVCTDEVDRLLPEGCAATVLVDPRNPSYAAVLRSRLAPVPKARLDRVGAGWCDRVARALSPLRDVGAVAAGEGVLPAEVRLLDLLGLEPPTADAVRAAWLLQPHGTRAVLGAGTDGPVAVDLRADGPHVLVAGTSGSGRSELLRSLTSALAVGNRPDRLHLVLVDQRGDGAFADVVRLPHTVATATRLDARAGERVLASLHTELQRRERVLAGAGVVDLDDHQALLAGDPRRTPVPRLVVVVDGLAELARDVPDLVAGLPGLAERGRRLGVHLVLATDRPGAVGSAVRALAGLRVALRLPDPHDSTEVLGTPDASWVPASEPGRALVRTDDLRPVQVARIGAARPGAARTLPPPFLASVDWHGIGYPAPRPPRPTPDATDTDLAVLVDTIRAAAELEGVAHQPRLWPDPLPEVLPWSSLVGGATARPGTLPPLPYGRTDRPGEPHHAAAALDLVGGGQLLVVGDPGSGRSQVLRTVAASAARLTDPADLQLYAVDLGPDRALASLAALPHCGAVIGRDDAEQAARLLAWLRGLVEGRRRGQRDGVRPRVLVLLDRWEDAATTLDVDAWRELAATVLREGGELGVHLAITGDRTLAGDVRLVSATPHTLALRLGVRSDYALLGLHPRQVAETVPPGRGYTPGGTETQVALVAIEEVRSFTPTP